MRLGLTIFLIGVILAVAEIMLSIWLIVKGFNPSAIDSRSARTDIDEIT